MQVAWFRLIFDITIYTKTQRNHVCVCARVFCEKAESAKDGVGVTDSNYLASLAKSLETFSEQMTAVDRNWTNVTGWRGNGLLLGAGSVAAVVRGVRALALARSTFTDTACSYGEVRVRFAMYLQHLCYVSIVGRRPCTAVAETLVIIIWL